MSRDRIGIIGGGSAAEALVRAMADRADVTVFEPGLVGGECPFLACMPSKAMLHGARHDMSWEAAIAHRNEVTDGLDDDEHARELEEQGAGLVRAPATIVDSHTLASAGDRHRVDHIVVASGSTAIIP